MPAMGGYKVVASGVGTVIVGPHSSSFSCYRVLSSVVVPVAVVVSIFERSGDGVGLSISSIGRVCSCRSATGLNQPLSGWVPKFVGFQSLLGLNYLV